MKNKALAVLILLLLAGCGFDWFPNPPHNGQFNNNSTAFNNRSTPFVNVSTPFVITSTVRRQRVLTPKVSKSDAPAAATAGRR